MRNRFSGTAWCLSLLVVAITAPVHAEPAVAWHTFQHEHVLGTGLELKFATPDPTAAAAAETAALAEIDRLAGILSGYDATSEFRRWQATRDVPVPVSAELFEVLALFDAWRDRTDGALDASAEAAGQLWRRAAEQQRVPTAAELAATVAAVHQSHWRLDPVRRTATHLSDAPLRLNSFAKSYVIEKACAAALASGAIATAVVNLGGDLVVRGRDAERVALTDPIAEADNDLPLTHLRVGDRAVATSGGYRRGVEINGRWYSHLIDPRTGLPAGHVLSATVTAPRATDAGALATALCVLPEAQGAALAAQSPGVEFLLVLSDGRRVGSPGWAALEIPPPAARPNGLHAAVTRQPAAPGQRAVWDPAFELVVNLEIASVGGGRAKRPFLAIWIEDKDNYPLRTLALWFHGVRWLPDLRAWSHADHLRAMTEGTRIAESIASATRGPGKYTLRWDGTDAAGQPVPAGRYTVAIEIAREHGTHQLIRREVDFGGTPQHVDLPGNIELAGAALDYRRKNNAR